MKRLKLILTVTILFVIFFSINTSNAQLLNLTVKGGFNLSDISGDFPGGTQLKSGFNLYLSKDFINLLVVTVSGEAGYTQKGFDQEVILVNELGIETGTEKIHDKLNYIDLSVLGKLRIPGIVVFPYILAGPSLGIKVSSGISSPSGTTYPQNEQVLNDFSSTSFGFKFGLGLEIGIPVVSLVAEVRYNPDITTSYDKNNIKLKNKVYEFLLGVKF